MERYFHWLVTVQAVSASQPYPAVAERRWWSGEGALTFSGNSYEGTWSADYGALVTVSAVSQDLNDPTSRVRFVVALDPSALPELASRDPGIPEVTLQWITSTDHGATWSLVPRRFVGQVSAPTLNEGNLEVEVEQYSTDTDAGITHYWSHESHIQRFPGDMGFSFVRELTRIGTETRWPNVL